MDVGYGVLITQWGESWWSSSGFFTGASRGIGGQYIVPCGGQRTPSELNTTTPTSAPTDQAKIIDVTANDAYQSLLAGAVNKLADTAVFLANLAIAIGDINGDVEPIGQWHRMEPRSNYFGRQGGAIAEGLMARQAPGTVANATKTTVLSQAQRLALVERVASGPRAKTA